MKSPTKRYLPILGVACLLSCQRATSPARNTVSEEKLKVVYIALLEEGERYRSLPADSTRHFRSDSIFKAFNTSEEEFGSTVASYRVEPKKWQSFFEDVVKKLDEKQKQATDTTKS